MSVFTLRAAVFFLLSLVLTAASGEAVAAQPTRVIVVGHRGTRTFAPENTIPSFLKAIELGADLLEMDLRETKDGEVVVIHDSTVNRTTDGRGAVKNLTLAELKRL